MPDLEEGDHVEDCHNGDEEDGETRGDTRPPGPAGRVLGAPREVGGVEEGGAGG